MTRDLPPAHILRPMLEGHPDTWAADVIGCSSSHVREARQALGVAPYPQNGRPSQKDRAAYVHQWANLLAADGYAGPRRRAI